MQHRTDQPSHVAAAQRGGKSGTVFATAACAAQRDQLVEHYWEHGWAVAEGVFSDVEVDYLLDECMRAAARDTADTQARLADVAEDVRKKAEAQLALTTDVAEDGRLFPRKVESPFMDALCPSFRALVCDARLGARVQALLGCAAPQLVLEQCFMKPPSCGSAKPLHQDNYFFECEPHDAVLTAWVALDDVTLENGCLHYISGSHRGPLLPHTAEAEAGSGGIDGLRTRKGDDWSNALDVDAKAALAKAQIHEHQVDPSRRQAVTVKRGGVIFHHGNTVHGSGENSTERWRRAYSSHWVAPGAASRSSIMETSSQLSRQARETVERREGKPPQPKL